jgi:hypothetical protein
MIEILAEDPKKRTPKEEILTARFRAADRKRYMGPVWVGPLKFKV